MRQRRKFSAEYKREAVAMLEAPGVTVNQIAAELGGWCRGARALVAGTLPGDNPCISWPGTIAS
jgi:hypothetical protein